MNFPVIDPVFFRLGPLQFRWYGLMYVLGFILSYFIIRSEVRRRSLALSDEGVADMIFVLALGVVLGGRFGYVLFYDLPSYLANPLKIFAIWQGGMSFHGGLAGVALATLWFTRKRNLPYVQLGDLAAFAAPVGLGLGRIGNFINGELYGRTTTVPWGIVFPNGGPLPRHPSQLYEALLEGLLLFVLVRLAARRFDAPGIAMATFLAGYGLSGPLWSFPSAGPTDRVFLGLFSMGQLLSLPLFLLGGGLFFWIWQKKRLMVQKPAK